MFRRLSFAIQKHFGLIATLIGFIVDSITLIALINSKVVPSIPLIDTPLGIGAQLTIWIIALITYLGFLREYWLSLSRKLSIRPEPTFSRFLFLDIAGFKHPYVLIPLALLVYFLLNIFSQMDAGTFIFCGIYGSLFILIAILVVVIKFQDEERDKREWQSLTDEQTLNRWIARIARLLKEKNYALHTELAQIYSESETLSIKALIRYSQQYEVEHDLALVTEKIFLHNDSQGNPIYEDLWILTTRNLVNSKPWQN